MKNKVAIVGRPNVGKSTLFNRLVGERVSIVENIPGVTRDRIFRDASWLDKDFTLIDTGGIIMYEKEDIFPSMIREQTEIAIEMADVIIFLVDSKVGLQGEDKEIANILRKTQKPVVVAVNKIDSIKQMDNFYDFYELGFENMFSISAAQGLGIGDLLDKVVYYFKDFSENEDDDFIKVAIIGRPNVGKSSILNAITGENRTIVSPIAGTTRDSIDEKYEHNGKKYMFIDTAGLRRKNKVYENVEKYSIVRSYSAIDRADVILMVLDATEKVTFQDTKIAGLAHESGKAIIIVVNKWDLIEKDSNTLKNFKKDIVNNLSFIQYAKLIFISAKTGKRLFNIIDEIDFAYNEATKRIKTGVLNDVLSEAVMLNQPPSDKGKRLKIYYGSQVSVQPPTFVLFINDKDLFHFSYKRYIENKLRESFGFEGTPIVILERERKDKSSTK